METLECWMGWPKRIRDFELLLECVSACACACAQKHILTEDILLKSDSQWITNEAFVKSMKNWLIMS